MARKPGPLQGATGPGRLLEEKAVIRVEKAVFRVSCFVSLENLKGSGLWLVASLHFSPPDGRSTRYDRQDFVALACRAQRTVQVRLRAPSGSRLVLTAPLTRFASPRGEKCRLVASENLESPVS